MLLRFLIALSLGLPVGAWTAASSLRNDVGVGALKVGEWTAWPREGSRDADPYTKAKVATRGTVPLGVGEGVAFQATTDAGGAPLDAACQYEVSGRTPKARVWTLAAHGAGTDAVGSAALRRPDGAIAALTARDLVRGEDGSFSVTIGSRPTAGDWIPLPKAPPRPINPGDAAEPRIPAAPMRIVLRLYDSPVSTSAELFEPTMPTIAKRDCRP